MNHFTYRNIKQVFFPEGERTYLQKVSYSIALFLFIFVLFLCALLPSRKKTAVKFANSKIKEILRSCLELLEASKQDSNSVIRLAHANYAQAYLNVARMLQNDEDIEESIGYEISALQSDLDEAQKESMKFIHKTNIKF